MRIFFDSSAYAKRFFEEPGSQRIEDLLQNASAVGLSILCFQEILSALNRKVREKSLARRHYSLAKDSLSEEISDIDIINISSAVIAGCTRLLETNPLRALDAIHIASAVEWNAELFVTSDTRQAGVARRSFPVELC